MRIENPTQIPLPSVPLDLDSLTPAQLRALRAEIDKRLPALSLQSVNLEHEAVRQLRLGQEMLEAIKDDADTPANQKAQAFNSVSAVLNDLIKQQAALSEGARLQRIEHILVDAMNSAPPEIARQFFEEYEKMLLDPER